MTTSFRDLYAAQVAKAGGAATPATATPKTTASHSPSPVASAEHSNEGSGAAPGSPPNRPREGVDAGSSAPQDAPGSGLTPKDLPVLAGVDLSALGLTPDQIAAVHEQTAALKAAAPPVDDMAVDDGSPSPIPVQRAGAATQRPPQPQELDPEIAHELDQARALKSFLEENPEAIASLADLAAKKARGEGRPVETQGPQRLTRQQYDELEPDQQLEYQHAQAAARAQAGLLPILQRLEAGLRDIKQGEQDRAIIAEKHGDFAALPKDHYLRSTVERIRKAQPGLTLPEAIEEAKALADHVQAGARRQIQADAARRASANVHKPETAVTRELQIDPRTMKAAGKSKAEILSSMFEAAKRKAGVE